MENQLNAVGECGDSILLKKLQIKPGCTSKVKPGKEKKLTLDKPISIGNEIFKRKISLSPKKEGMPLGRQLTSLVKTITETTDENIFIIETQTSIYEATII